MSITHPKKSIMQVSFLYHCRFLIYKNFTKCQTNVEMVYYLHIRLTPVILSITHSQSMNKPVSSFVFGKGGRYPGISSHTSSSSFSSSSISSPSPSPADPPSFLPPRGSLVPIPPADFRKILVSVPLVRQRTRQAVNVKWFVNKS